MEQLSKVTAQPQALWDNLVRNGCIDGTGSVLPKFLELARTSEIWEDLRKHKCVDQSGTLAQGKLELQGTDTDPERWADLVDAGYFSKDGTPLGKFQDLRKSHDLELDKNFKDKKEDICRILRNLHWRAIVFEWVESIAIALFLAFGIIRPFCVQAFKIPSGSMRMTLLEGDRIIVNKLRYGPKVPFTQWRIPGFSHPHRGDVVVFIYPEDPHRDFIKRLIAVGGETVEIREGKIYIDGKVVDDPPIRNIYYYNQSTYGAANKKIKVPEGSYFVLGDNSGSSRDSRFWGFVPEPNVIGRAELIYWPLNRIRFIK